MYRIIGADGREYGPITAEQLRQWIAEGRVNHQSRVQAQGATEWKTLLDFPELSATTPPPISPVSQLTSSVHVPNHLVPAILVTLCCCLPFGVPAIVYAAQVNGKLTAGDITGAQEASRKAQMWCWIAFGLGVVGNIIGGIIYGIEFATMTRHGFH